MVAVIGVALVVAAIAGGVGCLPAVKPLVKDTSAGNVATFTVAGATLLLADFTALLAWFTWQSITATRREAKIAEDSLIAIQKQAKIAERQVTATNAQTDVARAQLTASWRPILVERGMEAPSIDIHPSLEEAFTFETDWVNIGRGPAFIRKASSPSWPEGARRSPSGRGSPSPAASSTLSSGCRRPTASTAA